MAMKKKGYAKGGVAKKMKRGGAAKKAPMKMRNGGMAMKKKAWLVAALRKKP